MFDSSIQLMLACARPSIDKTEIVQLLRHPIDWDLVLEQAAWHCVSPLVYRSLQAEANSGVPPKVLSALQASFEENFHKNLFLSGQMIRLANGFRERNIPVIAYKGPVLCTYYGNLGLREFGDLDFLVAQEDVSKADDYLRQDGFHPHLYKSCTQEPRSLPFARAFHYEMVYTTADLETKVDLHWALMPGFWALSGDASQVWMRRRTVPLGGGALSTLSHEDTLLLLCAHGTKHMWSSLGWVCDVAALLHSVPDLEWPTLVERAKQLRILRAFSLGLHLAGDLLKADLPADLLRQIEQDPEIPKLARAVKETLFTRDARPEGVLRNCSFLMHTRENAKDAIRCAAEQIFQPTMAEWQSVALPEFLFPAYYLLRPARLISKYFFRSHADTA